MALPRDHLLFDVRRGVSARPLREQHLPLAEWMDPDAVAAAKALAYDPRNVGGKILVGAIGDRLIGIDDNRHIMTVAGSRAGKSVQIVGNLLHYPGSALVIDPKGELASLTAVRRAGLGQRVVVLDPFKRAKGGAEVYRGSYNPLSVLNESSETLVEDAGIIADAIVAASADAKDPHWDDSALHFIEGLILQVATSPKYQGRRTLNTVGRLASLATKSELDGEGNAYYALEDAMLENGDRLARDEATASVGFALEAAARDFYEKADTERASVLSTVRRHTHFLSYRAIQEVLTVNALDLADLKRAPGGVTIYLCLPALQMARCHRWLRIIVSQLLDAMEREPAKPAAPVLVCLDEFPVLGHMKQLENAAGQIASFGVRLWVVLQDWGQGKALYKDRWESFAANAGIVQFFGNADLTTTKYVSELLGKTAVRTEKQGEISPEDRKAGKDGISLSLELYDLLTAAEVATLFARDDRLKRQLVIWAGYKPMILQRVEYYDPHGPLARATARV